MTQSNGDPCLNPWHFAATDHDSICPSCFDHRRADSFRAVYTSGYLQTVGAHTFGNCYVCGDPATHTYNAALTAPFGTPTDMKPACPNHGLQIPLGLYSGTPVITDMVERAYPEMQAAAERASAEKYIAAEREACARIVCWQCGLGTPITGSVNGTLMHPGNCDGQWAGKACKCRSTKCQADGIWKRDPKFKEGT